MKIVNFYKTFIKNSKRSLLIKIFLVCTATSLLSVAVMGTYTYYYILKNLDIGIDKYEQKKLDETINTSNIILGEMQKLIVNYAMNNKFAQFAYVPRENLNERYLEIRNLQDFISNTINSSNYIENIYIYYEKENYVLDYSGLMPLEQYYDTEWYKSYTEMSGISAIIDTRKLKGRLSSVSEKHNNIITFIAKIPYISNSRDGAIILNIDARIISDLLKNITSGDDKALAFLVNEEGKILSSNNESYYYQDIYNTIGINPELLNKGTGSFKSTFNNTKMVTYFETSSLNNWKLIYMQAENIIFKKSVFIRNITLGILVLILLFTVVISLLFSFKVYNPIKKIISNIKSMTTVKDDDISDISLIGGSLEILFKNNQILENQIKQNEMIIKENFLNQLITGKLFNKHEAKMKSEYFSINLNFDYFKVAVIQNNSIQMIPFDVQKFEFDKISIINMVTKVFNSLNIEVICSQDSNDNILVLMGIKANKDLNEAFAIIEQTLEDIKHNAQKYCGLSVSVGLGSVHSDLADIGVSYKEALKALHYKFLKNDHSIISYTEISNSEKEELYYPIENEQKLITLIKSCDYEKTILLLNNMLDEIIYHNNNFDNLEVCVSNMIGIIQRCILEMNLNPKEVFGDDSFTGVSIDKFKNIQQFSEWVSDKLRKIIEFQIDLKKDNMKSIVSEISAYLNKVYMEELSLVSVANHFNYNSSYFCKIFKEKMKISFWEYVASIRIENSKKLLLNTDNTIEQIAKMVGYNNRFSYIRTFKKYTSITPSDFRTTNAKKFS